MAVKVESSQLKQIIKDTFNGQKATKKVPEKKETTKQQQKNENKPGNMVEKGIPSVKVSTKKKIMQG